MKTFLSALAVLALAATADAQVVYQRVCGPNGCQLVPVSFPSPPAFAPVPCQPPQAMPGAPCPAGVCADCTCAAGSCPAGCPTTTAGAAPAFADSRPYLFPRVRAFFEGRPRLFRRGCGF